MPANSTRTNTVSKANEQHATALRNKRQQLTRKQHLLSAPSVHGVLAHHVGHEARPRLAAPQAVRQQAAGARVAVGVLFRLGHASWWGWQAGGVAPRAFHARRAAANL